MRKWSATLLAAGLVLAWASTAAAAPSLDLFITGHSGGGFTGGSTTTANAGDTLTLDVVLTIDSSGFTGAAWDLIGVGTTAISNSLIPGASGPAECPSPPNLAPGTCFSITFKSFSALAPGVIDSGSSTTGYDVAGLTGEFVPSTMIIGRGVFVATGSSGSVSTFFAPGVGGVTDGAFGFSIPLASSATWVPEPSTMVLFGVALLGAVAMGRRRA